MTTHEAADRREWRPIPGYPGYEIADDGAVRVGGAARMLAPSRAKNGGYLKVFLRDHLGGTVHHSVHNLVARVFIGPPPGPKALVMHLDHDPTNNRVGNLAWGTHGDNARGRLERGTVLRGEQLHNAQLTPGAVVEIREAYAGGESLTDLATRFGVNRGTVHFVVSGKTWRHVGGPAMPAGRRRRKGEKLTEDDVRAIRAMAADGIPQHRIGARFGVSQGAVSSIVTGKRWKDLS